LVVTLSAYFDESFDEAGFVYTLAGYIGPVDMWDGEFAAPWNDAINSAPHKISEFKTSDCRQGAEEFSGDLGWTKDERTALTKKMVSVIADRTPEDGIIGYSASVVFPGKAAIKEDYRKTEEIGFQIGLIAVMHWAMRLANDVLAKPSGERFQLVLDHKPKFHKYAGIYYPLVMNSLGPGASEHFPFPIFEDSRVLAPLQAADLLAYESRKETRIRSGFEKTRPVSGALRRLVESRRHYGEVYTYSQIRSAVASAIGTAKADKESLRGVTLFETGSTWRAPEHYPRA